MDPKTVELRDAHDVLAAFYVDYLDGWLDRSPVDRAVLDLFCELTRAVGPEVADVGCGTGHLMRRAGRSPAPRHPDHRRLRNGRRPTRDPCVIDSPGTGYHPSALVGTSKRMIRRSNGICRYEASRQSN